LTFNVLYHIINSELVLYRGRGLHDGIPKLFSSIAFFTPLNSFDPEVLVEKRRYSMKFRNLACWAVILILPILVISCSQNPAESELITDDSSDSNLKERPVEEGAGNCLSFPVIWSDDVTKPLRGVTGVMELEGLFTESDNPNTGEYDLVPWYHQQDDLNVWCAETSLQVSKGQLAVSRIDWGDNLEAKSWYTSSVVRVETVLYQDLPAGQEMLAYHMLKLNDEQGPAELWGTNGQTYLSPEATVYSGCARLTIQKLALDRDDPNLNLTWNPSVGAWEGDVTSTIFNGGVWQAVDGPGYYSAEINVQGKCIYGFNWFVRNTENAAGDYRITFSLDNSKAGTTLNTFITPSTSIWFPEEVVITSEGEEGDGDGDNSQDNGEPDLGGGIAQVSPEHNLSYIDVRIVEKNMGGGRY